MNKDYFKNKSDKQVKDFAKYAIGVAKELAKAELEKRKKQMKKEKVKNLDEVSKEVLKKYGIKAIKQKHAAYNSGDEKIYNKRRKGTELARAKSFHTQYKNSPLKAKVNATEEIENLDEVSLPKIPNKLKVVQNWKKFGNTHQAIIKTRNGKLYQLEWDQSDGDFFGWAELDPKAYTKGKLKFGNSGNDSISDINSFAEDISEETENLDELSGSKLGAYIVKSKKDEKERKERGLKVRDALNKATGKNFMTPYDRKLYNTKHSRGANQNLAMKKLTGKARINAKEEAGLRGFRSWTKDNSKEN